jgi:hypothetical protein
LFWEDIIDYWKDADVLPEVVYDKLLRTILGRMFANLYTVSDVTAYAEIISKGLMAGFHLGDKKTISYTVDICKNIRNMDLDMLVGIG